MARSRYRPYDGGDPLAAPVDLAEALDEIGQDVMAGYSPERAMREFLRRGGRDPTGLDDLARQVSPDPERRPEMEAATGHRSIPTLVDGETVVEGEDDILAHLERSYPEPPEADAHRAKDAEEGPRWRG